ncbi:MAG: hypothetical protein Q9164_001702 [Protoblastenia rupestris]
MVNVGKGTPTEPNIGWSLFIVSVVMVIVSGLFVVVRIAIRLSRRMMGMDDYMIILWFYGAQITYKLAVAFYKESMLFLYLRIFPSKQFRLACFFLIGLVTSSGIAFVLVTIWQCNPIAAFWDKDLLAQPGARCFSSEAFWFSYSVINIILDVLILLLPIHEVLKLQLPSREKIALCAVFSLGIFVCATTIIRTTTLAESAKSKDPTWGVIPATVWSVVEANTGTICACLPMLRQPLSRLFPRLFSTSKSSGFGRADLDDARHSYPLRSKTRGSKRGPHGTADTVSHYHQWALADGTIMSAKDKDSYSSRESEDRERLTDGQGPPAILRTTDVSVTYGGKTNAGVLPIKPNKTYIG